MSKNVNSIPAIILIILAVLAICYVTINFFYGVDCHVIGAFSQDKYCYGYYSSNYTNELKSYVLRSHKQDIIDELNKRLTDLRLIEMEKMDLECYNKGYDYNLSFDIQRDYNLSCVKLDYLNDHLIDNIKEGGGGYISGRYSGFLSHGSIDGRFNIVQKSLAVGKLVKSMSGHVDCNNQTSNNQIDYYDESEFVIYYTERCLQ